MSSFPTTTTTSSSSSISSSTQRPTSTTTTTTTTTTSVGSLQRGTSSSSYLGPSRPPASPVLRPAVNVEHARTHHLRTGNTNVPKITSSSSSGQDQALTVARAQQPSNPASAVEIIPAPASSVASRIAQFNRGGFQSGVNENERQREVATSAAAKQSGKSNNSSITHINGATLLPSSVSFVSSSSSSSGAVLPVVSMTLRERLERYKQVAAGGQVNTASSRRENHSEEPDSQSCLLPVAQNFIKELSGIGSSLSEKEKVLFLQLQDALEQIVRDLTI